MTDPTAPGGAGWQAHNQARLVQELARVRGYLERPGVAGEPDAGAAPPEGAPAALDLLAAKFRLTPFERDVLLLCAGVELDARLAGLCATAQGDPARRTVSFGLAMAVLPGAHWSALTPGATLRRWRLVRVQEGTTLTGAALAIEESVLHFLAGTPQMDERLAALVEPIPLPGALAPQHRQVAEAIVKVWSGRPGGGRVPVVQLLGEATGDKAGIAAAAARALGLRPFALNAALLPTAPAELDRFCREVEREGILTQPVLVLDCDELDDGDRARGEAVTRFLERSLGAVFVATRDRRPTQRRAVVAFEVPRPTAGEQALAWRTALGEAAPRLGDAAIAQLASHFNLGAQAVHAIATETMARGPYADGPALGDALWEGCRGHARPRLDALAQRLEARAPWDDLVLPEAQKQVLRDVAAQVRQRATVYEQWGFGRPGARGLGITALFAGTSGTGKTMAADVLGTELRLDVYRIDLSAVVSKYIGETEKNLRKIFDEAEGGGSILLFDEADALFGKRSDVKDSHDRYANIEVSYLLQRMESYRGLAILTTNLKGSLDTAFLRRIRFIVQFPFPDPVQRAEIWRRVFPRETPTEGLDAGRLAQLNVAGGNIKSIALNAAFLAAEDGTPVRMGHVLLAARSEYAKLEKPLTPAEVAGWEA